MAEVGGAAKAKQVARKITNTLSKEVKKKLTGKTLEVHIIPASKKLTDLPPWKDLAGKMTCNAKRADGTPNPDCVFPRLYSSLRGIGGTHYKPGKVAVAVGEETLVYVPSKPHASQNGYVLAHELGHAILDFGAPLEEANVADILADNPANHVYLPVGHPDQGAYTKSSADEYFAEGTAAMFNLGWLSNTGYYPAWLQVNEPKLYTILKRIYPGAV